MKKVAILFVVLLTSSFIFAQNTYVPDDKFEQALIDLGYDTTLDDYVVTANISGVTSLDVSNKEISDLTGIEAFTALTYLNCNSNKLTSLDVSANTALTELFCYKNQLTSLDVSANTALTKLSCSDNQLTSLDVSSNTALIWLFPYANQLTNIDITNNTILTEFDVSSNQLTSLDVSKNTALIELNVNNNLLTSLDVGNNTALIYLKCSENQLTSLDVSKNTALTYLHCYNNQLTSLDVSANTALTNLKCSNNKLTSLDVSKNTALTKLKCWENQLTSLDVSKNTVLNELQCWENQLTSLDVSKNKALDYLSCEENKLTSLDVSNNTALTYLHCADNLLTSLDVSANTALTVLYCAENQLTSLDVSKNTALTLLSCWGNQLTSLDVSSNITLTYLMCSGNSLTYLNMRNGVTDKLNEFYASNNSSLTCIEVLDPAWATANWVSASGGNIEMDAGVTFSVICGGTDLTTWHVATTGSDASGSGTETSPLASIQTAINATTTGDTVLVANGTYTENITFGGKKVVLASTFISTGNQSDISNTIIDGNSSGAVVNFYSHDQQTELKGFTIRNGAGWLTGTQRRGGGIRIDGIGPTYDAPTISDCIIEDNEADKGGGIYLHSSGATLKNLTIRNNKANGPGGGIFHYGSGVTLENVTISNNVATGAGGSFSQVSSANWNNVIVRDNSATNGGGGISISAGGTPTLRNVTVQNNSAKNGGGVDIHGSDTAPKFINVKIIGNKATGDASIGEGHTAGVNLYQSSPIFENVLIADNVANNTGGAIGGHYGTPIFKNVTITGNISADRAAFNYNNADPIFINCIIWNNSPQSFPPQDAGLSPRIVHSNIEGGWDGEGNIDRNPAFVNVDTTGGKKVDYHLLDWSPAIGAGVETISIVGATYTIPATDIEGNLRPNPAGSNPDMGAFENQYGSPQNAPPVIATQSDLTIAEDGTSTATLTATDANDDAITYSAVSDTNAVTVSVSSATLTLTPNANWHGVANIKAYASDGTSKDSTTFKLTVTPVNDAPTAFEWVSTASTSINITKSNLADTYELKWSESKDVDIDTIDYLISVGVGQFPAEMINETADTSMTITYQDIIDKWYPNLEMLSRGTLKFSVSATDGIDTVNVTGDDRVLFVNRYEYLSTESEGVPTEFALHENYPNPFNPTTTLRFDLPEVSNLTLTIYNMLGQKVRTFDYQNTSAGYHSVTWDATNDYGDPVGAGVYLYQLQTKDFVKTRKMVLLK